MLWGRCWRQDETGLKGKRRRRSLVLVRHSLSDAFILVVGVLVQYFGWALTVFLSGSGASTDSAPDFSCCICKFPSSGGWQDICRQEQIFTIDCHNSSLFLLFLCLHRGWPSLCAFLLVLVAGTSSLLPPPSSCPRILRQ